MWERKKPSSSARTRIAEVEQLLSLPATLHSDTISATMLSLQKDRREIP